MIILASSLIGIFEGWMIVSSIAVAREDTVLEDLVLGTLGGLIGILGFQLFHDTRINSSISMVYALGGSILFIYVGRKLLSVFSHNRSSSSTIGY